MSHHAAIMFLAGIGVPVLAALNAALGQRLGSPAAAAVILFAAAFCAAFVFWLIQGRGGMGLTSQTPPHLFTGGLFVAFYVLSITFIAPQIGVGNAVFFVLIGQLVSAALIDHFGLFGARPAPLEAKRILGLTFMALGVWITQRL